MQPLDHQVEVEYAKHGYDQAYEAQYLLGVYAYAEEFIAGVLYMVHQG